MYMTNCFFFHIAVLDYVACQDIAVVSKIFSEMPFFVLPLQMLLE